MPKCENCYHTCLKTPSRMRYNRFSMCYNEITGVKLERLKTGVELKYGGARNVNTSVRNLP